MQSVASLGDGVVDKLVFQLPVDGEAVRRSPGGGVLLLHRGRRSVRVPAQRLESEQKTQVEPKNSNKVHESRKGCNFLFKLAFARLLLVAEVRLRPVSKIFLLET